MQTSDLVPVEQVDLDCFRGIFGRDPVPLSSRHRQALQSLARHRRANAPADAPALREAIKRAMQMLQAMGDTEEGVTMAFRTLAEAVND